MKIITKLVAISILLVVMSGCVPLLVAGIGAVGTIAAGRAKYNGDLEKAKALEIFRDEVTGELKKINDVLNSDMVEVK
jgi:hypothetical protein